jgi:hypothetical protein
MAGIARLTKLPKQIYVLGQNLLYIQLEYHDCADYGVDLLNQASAVCVPEN